jgi:hypothetical protein
MTPSGPFGMIRIFIGIIAIIMAMDGITIGETAMTVMYTQEHQDSMMDEAIAQAFVAARRKLATEHQSRLIKARELVVDRATSPRFAACAGPRVVPGSPRPRCIAGPPCHAVFTGAPVKLAPSGRGGCQR